jgi:ubiquitin carboxyl-terminal hydrolase 34
MEDLDPQATRKRPRLDSGSGVSPTLSLDGTSRTASVAPASDMDEASDAGRPASKVTLNMKSPLTSNSTAQPTISDSDRELQTDADITPNVICLSSSPSTPQSPEIEVAEPEDIDQESTTSNWRSLDQVLHEQDEPEIIEIEDTVHLAETFPKLDDDMGHRDNFKAIGDMIEHG